MTVVPQTVEKQDWLKLMFRGNNSESILELAFRLENFDVLKKLWPKFEKVTSAVSGRTTYLLVGDDPGESKIKKATEKKVEQIDEDKLLELIRTKPGKKSKYEIAAEMENEG